MLTRTYRLDYQPPAFLVDRVDLGFDLEPDATRVRSCAYYQRNPQASSNVDLILNGEGLQLNCIFIDDQVLNPKHYQQDGNSLRIFSPPDQFKLSIENTIVPSANTDLSGLYLSHHNFLTQCEAEGFRRITFFQDRPDVMAEFTVMLRADKKAYPVLLSNGNLIECGDFDDGRHYAKWHDPFKKPCYLFALVAGQFCCNEKTITRADGRPALLQIYAQESDIHKTDYALQSLERAIKWDYTRFGLDLDLERFMIVAASDFNMGAMENKGLNIFNARYVLCSSDSATDDDFDAVESVIGHEYFHNWTGNRVTCRDWFQLTLKEGLTVFRDQEFSADQLGDGRVLKRIDDVKMLRQHQMPEDSGPMSHPIRPESYLEINNFYTATIYEKGAEVIRMLHTLLGEACFTKGLTHYLSVNDGTAATCDDFVSSMEIASGRDLQQFMRWYSQSGTPQVRVTTHYDHARHIFRLDLQQMPAHGHDHEPLHIPLLCGLLDEQGVNLLSDNVEGSRLIELRQEFQSLEFTQITRAPTLSILRNFSAPVHIIFDYDDEALLRLASQDSDDFNRWEAGQNLALRYFLRAYQKTTPDSVLPESYLTYQKNILNDGSIDAGFRALLLNLPSYERFTEALTQDPLQTIDPQRASAIWQGGQSDWAQALHTDWHKAYLEQNTQNTHNTQNQTAYSLTGQGSRRLQNLALHALLIHPNSSDLSHSNQTHPNDIIALAERQYQLSNNMNDRFAALRNMVHDANANANTRTQALLNDFYTRYQHDSLIIDKWFALQASAPTISMDQMHALIEHPDFSYTNPNRVRSVVHNFCLNNPRAFHRLDGAGYDFWLTQLTRLCRVNVQVAGRLARALEHWKKFTPAYQELMLTRLQIAQQKIYAKDVVEILQMALY